MPKHPPHLIELAKRGAEIQLRDLMHEIEMLVELFPHLRDSFDKDELPLNFIMAKGAGVSATRRKPMSSAAKQAVSKRMKKYWAAKRKAEKA
jgi:hypothetical protein